MRDIHLIVIWPQVKHLLTDIINYIISSHGVIANSFNIFPNQVEINNFIQKLYDQSDYERNRMNKKINGVLNNISKGISVIIFSIDSGSDIVIPDSISNRSILDFKQSIRDFIMNNINPDNSIDSFETIHMTNNRTEFCHDILAVRWLQRKTNPNPIKIGIIGAGVAASLHAKALSNIPYVEKYVYDINKDISLSFAQKYNFQSITDINQMYEMVDAIVIATPSNTHYEIFSNAIDKGKHVLCEKPMAFSLSDASKMFDKSASSGLVCAIGFNYRFFDITHILKSNIIGEKMNVDIVINRLFRENYDGGGVLMDLGIHLIDYIVFICNQTIDLSSCATIMKYITGINYYSSIKGNTEHGIAFSVTMSRTKLINDVGFYIKITGTKGELEYDSHKYLNYTIKKDNKTRSLQLKNPISKDDFFDFSDSIFYQDKEWIDYISGIPSRSLATFYDGLRSQTALDYFSNKGMVC